MTRAELIEALVEAMGQGNHYGGSRQIKDYATVMHRDHPAAKSIFRHVKKNPHKYKGTLGRISVAQERAGKMVMHQSHAPKILKKAFTIPKRR